MPDKDPVTGRFLPGHSLGHMPKVRKQSLYLEAIRQTVTPADIAGILNQWAESAARPGASWREREAFLRFVFDQVEGKPVQRVLTGRADKLTELLDRLSDDNDGSDGHQLDDDAIAGEIVGSGETDGRE